MKLRRTSFLTICFFGLFGISQALADEPTIEQLRMMLPHLTQAIYTNPKDVQSRCTRGYFYERTGDFQRALADFNAAAQAEPNAAEAYSGRLIVYLELKDYTNALKDANTVVSLKPDADAYCNRGDVYSYMNQERLAIADFKKALELNHNSAMAYDGLAEVAFKNKEYNLCVNFASKALSVDPHITEAFYFRGKSYEALKRWDLAKYDLEAAIKAGYKPGEVYVQSK